MDPLTTSAIVGLIGTAIGLIGKIIWDWLKIRKNGSNGYSYNGRSTILYQIQQDLALQKQSVDRVLAFTESSEFKRLMEENHELFTEREDFHAMLKEQNKISTKSNVLLADLRDEIKDLRTELSRSTGQFAAVAEGLAAALKKLKES